MAADEMTAAGIPATMEAELRRSQQSALRLLEGLARKVGSSRAAEYVRSHSAREIAEEVRLAASRRPVYAMAVAAAAGFILGCVVRRTSR
jgi:ElaB/YqjD/DUF883 family membrane-anchored ribosome-binding protein